MSETEPAWSSQAFFFPLRIVKMLSKKVRNSVIDFTKLGPNSRWRLLSTYCFWVFFTLAVSVLSVLSSKGSTWNRYFICLCSHFMFDRVQFFLIKKILQENNFFPLKKFFFFKWHLVDLFKFVYVCICHYKQNYT